MQTVAGQGTPVAPAPAPPTAPMQVGISPVERPSTVGTRGAPPVAIGTTPENTFSIQPVREGPSASLSNAERVRAGEGEIYTTQMHKEGIPEPPKPPVNFQDAQQQLIAQTAGVPQGIPTPAQAIANVGSPYSIADQQRLAQYGKVFREGAHRLAPGALESMTPTERSLFSSAARASGIRPEDFEATYKRSRLQTGESALTI